jgi:hypothetical protein
MIATYMMVDDPTLQTLTALSGEALSQKVLELEDEIDESAADTAYHELWDALHFFLTGASATTPIENNHCWRYKFFRRRDGRFYCLHQAHRFETHHHRTRRV